MNHLEEIRAKLNIEELVGGYVQLKKAGRNLKGLCPFHNDSRPSFMVSPEKGIAYCFSCNTGGDIFKFIQLIEKVEFPEAVRILAERTGVKLPDYKPELQDQRMRLLKANETAVNFYAETLKTTEEAKHYFELRGLSPETIATWKLGFSPDSYKALKEYLTKAGFTEKELLAGGLLNQRSIADQNTYDRFRGRLMFPIADHQGNWVGFGGRIMGEGEPKYLNSPDTPVYNKSYVLYGLHQAKEAIKKENLAIFVEGYMDVIACHQAGTKNVIATSGTALTAGQLQLIKRYTNHIALAFDQDQAGMEATQRAIELIKEADLNVKIIIIPNGKDPDECIKESKTLWLKAIESAVPAMDFYFNRAFKTYDKTTLEGKKAVADFLLPIIKLYPSALEQNEYLERLAFELRTDSKFLWEDMKKINHRTPSHSPAQEASSKKTSPINFNREELVLAFILSHPSVFPIVKKQWIETSDESDTEKIYKALKNVYDSKGLADVSNLKEALPEVLHTKIDMLSLLIDEHYPDINEEAAEKEVLNLLKGINQNRLQSARKEIEFKIRSAQDPDERNLFLHQYNEILKLTSKL